MRRISLAALTAIMAITLFVAGPAAVAQSADSGAIAGTISDQNGSLVAHATITVTNGETAASVQATTNEQGEYRVSQLSPATYTMSISAQGFKTTKVSNIVVTVGVIATVTPQLAVGDVSQNVEVTEETPMLHTQSSEISTVIDQNMIDNLPINGRRASNFTLLTPGVVSNSDGFGLLSFRGISFLLNNSTVDGMDDNQAYFSEQRGRTRAAYSISQAAVQEFQVNTSNFSAEYGRSAGGVINTVTKSGSNAFHGELFFYDRDNDFGASNPYTSLTKLDPSSGTYVTTNYKSKDWRKQWGFGIGGPIIRDKLFFFYSYDQSLRNFPGTAWASTSTTGIFAPASPTLPAGDTCSTSNGGTYSNTTTSMVGNYGVCNLSVALYNSGSAANYQQAATYYALGQKVLADELGTVPRSQNQAINFPKLDWQINDRNHVTMQYTRFRDDSPAGIQTQQDNTYGRASFGNDFVKEDYGIIRWANVMSSSMVNELRFQFGRDFEYGTSQTPLGNELPLSNNAFNRPADISIGFDYDAFGFDIGKPVALERGALPNERRLQGADGWVWSHGKHTTKAGFDINRVFDYISNLYGENGSYSEDTGPDFFADYFHATLGVGGTGYKKQYYQFSQGFGNPAGEIATTDYAGYLTDDWRATPRLTIQAGVRYEYEYIPANPYANTTGISGMVNNTFVKLTDPIPQTANRPDDRNNIQPRVGFAWDVTGKGSTTLRGGYGLFNGRIINSNILQTYLNSGSPNGQINLQAASTTTCNPNTPLLFPSIFPSTMQGALQFQYQCPGQQTTVAYLDKHLQNPQVHEIDFAIEQKLTSNTVLSLTYMGSLGRELASAVDTNTGPSSISTVTYIVKIPTTAPNTGFQLPLPRGGVRTPPLRDGQTVTLKEYVPPAGTSGFGARTNAGVYQLLDFKSNVNSMYNGFSAMLTHRFSQGFSLMAHYTWAHAMDYNPYLSTVYGSNQQLDPQDISQEYGNSVLDVRNRFVFSGMYRTTSHAENRWVRQAITGWQTSVIFQSQTGLPFSAMSSKTAPNSNFSGIIGAGGINRIPKYDANHNLLIERDAFNAPGTQVLDLRLGRSFFFDSDKWGHYRLEFFAEAFNLFNHQNITQINNQAYTVCSSTPTSFVDPRTSVGAQNCPADSGTTPSGASSPNYYLLYNPLFGTNRNSNSNVTYTPRQLEGAIRLHF